jgi:pimeloyl-ACP methyl ester carboxylesterase
VKWVPIIDRDGVTIRYEAHGRGPPLLLTHCFGSTMRLWDRQVAEFAGRHRIILWDIRGHGGSGDPVDPAAYSQELTVGDMAAILDACGIERATVGGMGLGGYMSLAFHATHRDRVEGLILSDTGAGFRNHEARTAWNHRARSRAHNLEMKGMAALGGGREVRFAVHRSALGLAAAARGMLVQSDSLLLDSLPTIAVPTLIVVGANDGDHFATSNMMAAVIPGARRVVIQSAGAIPNIDQPRSFNRAIGAFLDHVADAAAAAPFPPLRRPRQPATPPAIAGWTAYR